MNKMYITNHGTSQNYMPFIKKVQEYKNVNIYMYIYMYIYIYIKVLEKNKQKENVRAT